jgi:hypothetical protein
LCGPDVPLEPLLLPLALPGVAGAPFTGTLGLPVVTDGLGGFAGCDPVLSGVDGASGVDGPVLVSACAGSAKSMAANVQVIKSVFVGVLRLALPLASVLNPESCADRATDDQDSGSAAAPSAPANHLVHPPGRSARLRD